MKLCLSKTPEMDGKGSLEPELKPSQVVGQEVEGSASGLPAGYQDILTRLVLYRNSLLSYYTPPKDIQYILQIHSKHHSVTSMYIRWRFLESKLVAPLV